MKPIEVLGEIRVIRPRGQSPAAVFRKDEDSTAYLPLANRGTAYSATDWLYHKECVSRRHPVFDGLQAPGIMDWDYYGPVVPHEIYEGLDAPDEMMAASFTTKG